MAMEGLNALRVYDLVKLGGVVFANGLLDVQHPNFKRSGTEGNFNNVTDLHVIGRFGGATVDRHMGGVAGVVCHGAPLDDATYLQVLIETHISSGSP